MEMDGKAVLEAAGEIRDELTAHRRRLHENPEVGASLPETAAYVAARLKEMGYAPVELCRSGITASITGADTGRCILLRADMDGLRGTEKTPLDFCARNGNMHACGHDLHTAMLLGAARLLRRFQGELQGTVKLVFQPDEEGFTGAKAMLAAGVLENPAPSAGFALHVHSGTPSGTVLWGQGTSMAGCTLFRVTVHGVGCHGAMPETGVDPLNIAAHIFLAIQAVTAREVGAKRPAVVTVGKLQGGQAPNIIPQEAVLEGTIRTFDRQLSAEIFRRIGEIADATARAFRGTAETEELSSAPPLRNDPELVGQMASWAGDVLGADRVYQMEEGGMGSEDFAAYTWRLPCAYLLLGAGTAAENPLYGKPMHNEAVVFNEDILPLGAAVHTYCALRYLARA